MKFAFVVIDAMDDAGLPDLKSAGKMLTESDIMIRHAPSFTSRRKRP
jgi:hypothetical protein